VDGPSGHVETSLFSTEKAALPIARVGDRTVTLSELTAAIGAAHRSHADGAKAGRKDFRRVLDRLIAARLVAQEAEAMGLDELDEFKAELARFEEMLLKRELQEIALRGLKPDPAEVERIYGEMTREWQLSSALFEKAADAKLVAAAALDGDFAALVRQAVASKKATGGETGWFTPEKMLPPVVEAVIKLKPGQVAPPVQVTGGFALVRLVGVRQRKDPAARRRAEAAALEAARSRRLREYYEAMERKRVHRDQKLIDGLDFEAPAPGFAALEQDARAVATIDGAPPVTVAEVAAEVRAAFFHGVNEAIKEKRVNAKKQQYVDSVIARRLVALEVAGLKLADSPEHKRAVAEERDATLFNLFVQQVVAPDVKVTDQELQAYYDAHKKEFTYPAFYSLQSLAFATAPAARAAFDKLKAGTDFNWLRQNAEGIAPTGPDVLQLDGSAIAAGGLSPEVAKAVTGARAGDVRLMDRGALHYVIAVRQVTEPRAQPFAEVRKDIAPKVFDEQLQKSLDDWLAKLRKARPVKVYITKLAS